MKYSKRAGILAEVLEYVNNGDWDASGEFLIFGKEAFERYIGASMEEASGIEDSLRELISNAKVQRGKHSVQKRISLERLPKDSTEEDLKDWFSRLPEPLRRALVEGFSTEKLRPSPL